MKLHGEFNAPDGVEGLQSGAHSDVDMPLVEDFCMFNADWPSGVVSLMIGGETIVARMYVATLFDYSGSREETDIKRAILEAIKANAGLAQMDIIE